MRLPSAQLVGTNLKFSVNPITHSFNDLIGITCPIVDVREGSFEDFKQNIQGKVVLYQESSPWFPEVLKRAKQGGVKAILSIKKDDNGNLLYGPRDQIETYPVSGEISRRDGLFLREKLAKGMQHIQFLNGETEKSVMTKLSSWGITYDGTIKPDLVAPGYSIMSTNLGNTYHNGTGTSYAAPMVTGAVALVKEAHPDWSIGEVVSSLCSNAGPLEDVFSGKAYSPDIQGCGQLNVNPALIGETFLFPHRISLIMRQGNTVAQKNITIKNKSKHSKTYLLHEEENDMPGITLSFPRSITVGPGGTGIIPLKAAIDEGNDISLSYLGRLYITAEQEKLNIPFLIKRS